MGDVHDSSYYAKCMVGGIFACGLTHAAVCPLDIVKCRRQVSIRSSRISTSCIQLWSERYLTYVVFVVYRQTQVSIAPSEMASERSTPLRASKVSPS